MSEQGRPKYFSTTVHVDACRQLAEADESEMALKMLDMVPAFYRDHPDSGAKELKKKLYEKLMSVKDYATDKDEKDTTRDFQKGYPIEKFLDMRSWSGARGQIVEGLVVAYNNAGEIPHLYEFGPSNFFLPYGLRDKGLKFTYDFFSINKDAEAEAKVRLADVMGKAKGPSVFICLEVIEHLWNEDDIYHVYAKSGIDADSVVLSTPLYTMAGGMEGLDRELGHIRTYTPTEFQGFAKRHWPELSWSGVTDYSIVLLGRKNGI